MFEIEAEERTKEKYNFQSFITREQGEELWRDGAEFGYNKGLKVKINTTTISDNPIHDYQKLVIVNDYAKTIIQDLLNNSDEYARQRAIDFLKKEEEDD